MIGLNLIALAVGAIALQTLDGEEIAMSNYDERKGTVLIFMSSRCPVTREAIETINRIYE